MYIAALETIMFHVIDCSKDSCEHLVYGYNLETTYVNKYWLVLD